MKFFGITLQKKYLSLINKDDYIIIDAHLIRVLTRLELISPNFSHTQIENFIKSNLKNSNYTDFSNLLNLFGKKNYIKFILLYLIYLINHHKQKIMNKI